MLSLHFYFTLLVVLSSGLPQSGPKSMMARSYPLSTLLDERELAAVSNGCYLLLASRPVLRNWIASFCPARLAEAALSEILVGRRRHWRVAVGCWPTLKRLSAAGERVVLIGPPHIPFCPAWQAAGISLACLSVIQASG